MNSDFFHDHPGVRRSRLFLDASVRLRADGRQWQAAVLDASMSGFRVERPEDFHLAEGTELEAKLEVSGRNLAALPVILVRSSDREIALRLGEISPTTEADLAWLMERFGRLADSVDSE